MRRNDGFTLLEVLVALAIFAVVAASVYATSARSLRNAARLEDKTLATWIADNRITEMQLAPTPPGAGRENGEVELGGRRWQWQSEVEDTSEPTMRRVTLWVAERQGGSTGDIEDRAAVRLVGFIGTQAPAQ
jgi:general secretion pathway protein I